MSRSEGILTIDEVKKSPGWPGDEAVESKRVVVLECVEDIPCNPCETVCPNGAIGIGEPITNLPVVDGSKCNGCGACIAVCPGLAIFMIEKNYSESQSTLSLPYELLPVPKKADRVKALNRGGEYVTDAEVLQVVQVRKYDKTAVVTIAIDKKYVDVVRSFRF